MSNENLILRLEIVVDELEEKNLRAMAATVREAIDVLYKQDREKLEQYTAHITLHLTKSSVCQEKPE